MTNKNSSSNETLIDNHQKKLIEREEKYNEQRKPYGELLQLKQLVINTRLNRINAANRLQRTETFLQGINIYYSCFTAVLSILTLLAENAALSVWSVLLTVILAISIVYLNAQKYGNRAQELKTNYIALHRLLFEIEADEANNDTSNFVNHYTKYCELLQTSENHINLDNLRRIKQYGKFTCSQRSEYYFTMTLRWAGKTIAIITPVAVALWLAVLDVFNGILN